jgi:hypothetical protein
MTLDPRVLAKANAELKRTLDRGLARARQAGERIEVKSQERAQRARYKTGAAQSPTRPPSRSSKRDRQIVDILTFIEAECLDGRRRIRVKALAESFLFEQQRIPDADAPIGALKTDLLLVKMLAETDPKKRHRFIRRMKLRTSKGLKSVRIYGWDKHTDLVKAPFHAWSLDPRTSRAFTVIFDKGTVDGAKAAKRPITSHLQDRLSRLLRSRFGKDAPEFWFIVEAGTASGIHVHGGVEWPEGLSKQALLQEALSAWSGNIAPNAIKITAFTQPGTWGIYPMKIMNVSKMLIGAKTLTATRGLRRSAKSLFTDFHAHYRELTAGR